MKPSDLLKLMILIIVFILTYLFFHCSILFYQKRSLFIQGIIWLLITKSSKPRYRISISLFCLEILKFLNIKMIRRVEIKYTYDRHEKSSACIVNVCDGVLVPVMVVIC